MLEVDYWRPKQAVEAEIEIKKSRFIAYLEPVNTLAEADTVKAKIKALHPNARHHCWAQVVGKPFDVHACGSSDDGEPGGTAGRPMLAVLTGKPAGYIMVMVVRYFGGIKLGTGGLVRAYSGSVKEAFERAEWQLCLPIVLRELVLPYHYHQSILHLLEGVHGKVVGNEFTDQVSLQVELPKTQLEYFELQLTELAAGTIKLTKPKG